MRKIKLLIAAATLFGGSSYVMAQEDVTNDYLTNADLSTVDSGWTYYSNDFKYTNWKTDGDVAVVEFYSQWTASPQSMDTKNFKFSQTITMPAGDYRLAVNAFYRNGDGDGTNDDKAWIFVNGNNIDKKQNVVALTSAGVANYSGSSDLYKAANAFSLGDFSNAFDFTLESETEVEIGFQGFFNWTKSWCILGPVKLYKYSLEDYLVDYRAKVAEAEALYNSKMGAAVLEALQAAVVDESTFSLVSEVTAAIQTLTTAINNANASIADYANLLTAITNANNHTIYTPVFEASATIYSNAVSTAQGVYDAATVADCTAAITALTDGIHSAYENDYSVFANDYAYDYSTLLNQDMTQWASTDYVTMTADQHWNGQNGQRYYEQSGAEWGASAWSHAASETATLPAGKYVMSITARASADVTSTMSVKIGDGEAITVALPNKGDSGRGITTDGVGSFADGTYANTNGRGWEYRFIAFEVTEESPVTISFSSSTNAQYNWVSLAAPLLKGDVHPNQIKLNQISSLAATLAEYESQISEETYATFADHITAANNATVESTNLDDIISNLQADIETAKTEVTAIAAARASFQTMKGYADALVAVDNDNSEANATLSTAISDQAAAAEVNKAEDINTATSTLKTAMVTYVGAANPTEGNQFDCTFMLTNPDLTNFASQTSVNNVDGWYTEYTDGNRQVMHNSGVAGSHGDAFFEYWSETAKADNKFAFYQLVNLPEGTYQIQCDALASANGVEGATTSAVYFYANDTQGSLISADVLSPASISFVNSEEQDVMIGLKACTGNQFRWMGIGYVELYKVPAQSYTVDEDVAWDNSTDGAGAVTLNRTIKAGVNTLVLPFSMTQAEVEEYFGEGSKVYVVKEYNAETNNLSFTAYDGISANKPCLLQATEAGTSYELANRTIVAGEPEDAVATVSMIGTYAASMLAPQGSYIISGGMIYNVDSDVTLKNTRAYLLMETGEGVRTITMTLDDETTGIITLENGELKVETGTIYDLSGRKVLNPTKGIYVVNGKKVMK